LVEYHDKIHVPNAASAKGCNAPCAPNTSHLEVVSCITIITEHTSASLSRAPSAIRPTETLRPAKKDCKQSAFQSRGTSRTGKLPWNIISSESYLEVKWIKTGECMAYVRTALESLVSVGYERARCPTTRARTHANFVPP
jgi:hypothetical protein